MPIFAYRCEACGFQKDALQKRSDPPLTDCPSCGKDTFRKQVTAPAFQLKGSGWYVTDFRDGGKGKGGEGKGGEGKAESATSPAPSSTGAGSSGSSAESPSASGSSGASTAPAASPAPSSGSTSSST